MIRQVDPGDGADRPVPSGDVVVVLAGYPHGTTGSTDLLRVHRLGLEDMT